MINLHSAILLARKIYDSRLAGGPEDARASGARMNADNARNRVRLMANEALSNAGIGQQLDAMVERIEADPELSHQVIRESLRSTIMSSFWLRS